MNKQIQGLRNHLDSIGSFVTRANDLICEIEDMVNGLKTAAVDEAAAKDEINTVFDILERYRKNFSDEYNQTLDLFQSDYHLK